MSTTFVIWISLAGVVAAVWLFRLCLIGSALRNRHFLGSRSYDGPPAEPPRISVIVAGKDEEDNIEACVSTLLEQDYPDFEVIAVNDRSSDHTPAILSRLERQHGDRLRVVTIRTLREGWFGKNNAMREGVAASTGQWLLFTDADCWQITRNTLTVAMRKVLDENIDFLSITPTMKVSAAWEPILMPVCGLVLIAWFLPERVNDPRKKTAYANGAFMLMRRSCYEAIGGHERVRREVNEDIHMARFAKDAGQRLLVAENDDLYRIRMYRNPVEAWHGWSRIFYGAIRTVPRLAISTVLVLVFSILPWVSLPAALVGLAMDGEIGNTPWTWAAGAWAMAWTFKQMVTWQFYQMLRVRGIWCFTYLIGAVAVVTMLVNAIVKAIGASTITWRGTTYRRDRLETERVVDVPLNEPAPTAVTAEAFHEPARDL